MFYACHHKIYNVRVVAGDGLIYNVQNYPFIIFAVNMSSLLNTVFHFCQIAFSSCIIQANFLTERRKYLAILTSEGASAESHRRCSLVYPYYIVATLAVMWTEWTVCSVGLFFKNNKTISCIGK